MPCYCRRNCDVAIVLRWWMILYIEQWKTMKKGEEQRTQENCGKHSSNVAETGGNIRGLCRTQKNCGEQWSNIEGISAI